MEALGVASGLAGLIAAADLIATKGYKYYTRAKGARAEINELVLEVQRLYGVLNQLRLLAICLETANSSEAENVAASSLEHFQACEKNLLYRKTELAKVDVDSKRDKLIWPFKTTETKELVLKIGRNRDDLSAALTADGLTALVTALSSTAKTLDTVEKGVASLQISLKETADQILRKEKDEMKIKVYNWYSAVNPYEKHEISKSLRYPETVKWIFECDDYKVWMEKDNSAIWLYGIPGAGKTILTCALIEEAKTVVSRTPGLALAYFYCENKSKNTQILSNLIGSLVKQLSAVSTKAYDDLLPYYTTCHGDHHSTHSPKATDLRALLLQVSRHFDTVLVIVDGVDECEDAAERASILSFLSTINSPDSGTIKIACTSQDEVDIRTNLAKFKPISIAALGADLQLFVSATIEMRIQDRSLRMTDPLLKEEIINAIVTKANGMFQWAKCQIDQICLLKSDKQRRAALKTLPKDLFETYQRILDRIDAGPPANKDLVKRSLRWMTHSEDTLSTVSLLTAIAIDIGEKSIDKDAFTDEEGILELCSSLVSKTNKKTDSTGQSTIQLSHFTVKEFLTNARLLEIPSLCHYYLDVTQSHSILAKVCLTYLNMDDFSRWHIPRGFEVPEYNAANWSAREEVLSDLYQTYPMIEYATNQWYDHLAMAGELGARFDLLCQLFQPERTTNFLTWLHLSYMEMGASVPTHASTLHLAASIELEGICRWLLEEGVDINIVDEDLGTPLLCCLMRSEGDLNGGHINPEFVRFLLENGANGSKTSTLDNGYDVVSTMSLTLELGCCCVIPWDLACEVIEVLLKFGAIAPFSKSTFWLRKTLEDQPDLPGLRLSKLFGRMLEIPSSLLVDSATRSKISLFVSLHGDQTDRTAAIRNLPSDTINIGKLIYSAACNGQDHVITYCIYSGKTSPKILARAIVGAVDGDSPSTLELLLQNCPLEVEDVYEHVKSAFVTCADRGTISCMKVFLAYIQDLNVSGVIVDENFDEESDEESDEGSEEESDKKSSGQRDNNTISKTSLTTAIESGHLNMVEFLATLNQVDFMATHNNENMLVLAVGAPYHRYHIAKIIVDKTRSLANDSRQGSLICKLLRGRFEYIEESDDIELIRLLIDQGYALDDADTEENTLLHAIFQGPVDCNTGYVDLGIATSVLQLLLDGYDSRDKPNQSGQLPLHLAIEKSFPPSIISLLIPKDILSWNGERLSYPSPLHLVVKITAVYSKIGLEEDLINVLDTLLAVPGVNANVLDKNGDTPLLVLAMVTTADLQITFSRVLLRFLQAGANINASRSARQSTVIYILAVNNLYDGLEEALKHNPCIFVPNSHGDSPLHLAIHLGHYQCALLLLDHENKIEARDLLPPDYDKSLGQKTSWGALSMTLAARTGRSDLVRLLHQHGQVKAIKDPPLDNEGMSPLLYAIQNNHISTVETLIELGGNVNINGRKGTGLHIAASLGFGKMISLLLEAGADPLAVDQDGLLPWINALVHGHKEVRVLLEPLAQKALEEAKPTSNISGENFAKSSTVLKLSSNLESQNLDATPGLHKYASVMGRAIQSTNQAICLALLQSGFDVNAIVSVEKETSLHFASCVRSAGALAILNLLLEWKADSSIRNSRGFQALHFACINGLPETVQTLLDHGAEIKSRCEDLNQSSLHLAAEHGDVEVVKRLLKHASTAEQKISFLEMLDQNRQTPLLVAIENERLDISRLLILEGADVHKRDILGQGMLHLAGTHGDKEFISDLLGLGLDINLSDWNGRNILHFLARRDCSSPTKRAKTMELAHLLFGSNIDISSKDKEETSPLHLASRWGNEPLVEELLKRMEGHEINTLSQFYGTPLLAAAFSGHVAIVKLLLKAGADPSIKKEGETPLQAARMQDYKEVVKVLEEWMDTSQGAST